MAYPSSSQRLTARMAAQPACLSPRSPSNTARISSVGSRQKVRNESSVGARHPETMKPPFNRRGFSRLWGEVVTVDGIVGWGGGERALVLYVRVQGDTSLDESNS